MADEAQTAPAILGSHVLVGITCTDDAGGVLAQIQVHGRVTFANANVVELTREDGTVFGLPPALDLFEPAGQGEYTLRSTGEVVVDPDYLVTFAITVADEATVEDLAAHGYVPKER